MKKQLALLLSLFLVMAAQAQNDSKERKLHLGFMGTSSFGWMSTDSKNISGGGLQAGVGFGIYGDYFFAENYALSVEVLHSTQGFKLKADSICTYNTSSKQFTKTGSPEISYRMRTFQVPLTLKLRTNEIGYWRYYGQLGVAPTIAYRAIKANFTPGVFENSDDNEGRLINDNENDFISGENIPNTSEEDAINHFLEEDNISSFRLPIVIGAGAEWNISGNTSLLMGIRYEYGLLNLMKADHTIGRANVFNIVAGVRF